MYAGPRSEEKGGSLKKKHWGKKDKGLRGKALRHRKDRNCGKIGRKEKLGRFREGSDGATIRQMGGKKG